MNRKIDDAISRNDSLRYEALRMLDAVKARIEWTGQRATASKIFDIIHEINGQMGKD